MKTPFVTRYTIAGIVVAGIFGHVGQAAAQPVTASDVAAAQSLYDEGRRLYEAGSFELACPKFEASLQLDTEDLDARGLLALCNEKIGRLATAWTQFRDVRARAIRANRAAPVAVADEHIKSLDPRLARITIKLVQPSVVGVVIKKDGVTVPPDGLDVPLVVDHGTHTFVAEASGYVTATQTISIADQENRTVEIPQLVPATITTAPLNPQAVANDIEPVRYEPLFSTQRWIAISTAALGVVGLGVGSWAAFDARSKRNEAQSLGCSADLSMCPQTGIGAANTAYSHGNLASGFVIAGVALVSAGAVLWFTGESDRTLVSAWHFAPRVGANGVGFVAGRGF